MNNFYRSSIVALLLVAVSVTVGFAQATVSGRVYDAGGEPIPGVNILVKGTSTGTISGADGAFSFSTTAAFPLTLVVSHVSFKSQEVTVTAAGAGSVEITMSEDATMLGQAVVVSASRVEENILKSPVTIEKLDSLALRQAPVAEVYDALALVKGVQVTSSSLNFPQVNTRGFATIANERFVQWIDGIDGSAPILNFPLGNLVGIHELDLESMELVPGAASALYGPNAFNGILLMNSLNPFKKQGLSAQAKVGMTTSDAQGESYPYYNFAFRYAKAFNNKFAFKVNFSILDAEDWRGNDYRTDRVKSDSEFDLSGAPDFDGVNLYGDEALIIASASPGNNFAPFRRVGFREEDIIDDYSARNIKADAALHYKFTDKLEGLYSYRFGTGDAIYQGDAKYALRNFSQQFHKLELTAPNFFVRGYVTMTDAGDSYNLLALGLLMNEEYSPTRAKWAPEFINAYFLQGQSLEDARAYADRDRPAVGTQEFRDLVSKVRNSYFQGDPAGATFIDESRIWHGEFNYNFRNEIKFADVMIGGNLRQYDLFTNGTILNEDADAPSREEADFDRIKINEFGVYTQIAKTLGALRVTGSVRYDKNENFEGQVTPRFSVVYSITDEHNLRASFQTGFRNPSTQAQFIYFPASDATLLGSTEANAERYGVHNGGSYTRDSYRAFQGSGGTLDAQTGNPVGGNPALLVTTNVPYVQPEQLRSFEIGYKGVFARKLLLDLNYYYNMYNDFIGTEFVASKTPAVHQGTDLPPGTIYSLYSNSPNEVTSYGVGVGMTYNLPRNFSLTANYNYADFSQEEIAGRDFNAGFNTPNNKFNVGLGNRKITRHLGFNVNFRWQESFEWFSSFGTWVVPEFGVIDAALSYNVPAMRSVIKVGGTNIGGGDYRTNLGGPFVGRMYYISLTYDELFK